MGGGGGGGRGVVGNPAHLVGVVVDVVGHDGDVVVDICMYEVQQPYLRYIYQHHLNCARKYST